MSFKTDLHIHSWLSDGTLSPSELVEKYSADGYDLIAITDHEVADGWSLAEEACRQKELNMRVITGVEIATMNDGRELHILGYYFDPDNEELRRWLSALAAVREERNKRLLAALNSMGIDLSEEDLLQRQGQTYVGKPNFARALVAKGYIKSTAEAFEKGKFLESPEAKAAERKKPDTALTIERISAAGGMAVLAHPCKIKGLGERESEEFKAGFDSLIRDLKKKGLKGLECIYPQHSYEEKMFFVGMAEKYHLHITEGSDFHGDRP